MLPIRAAAPQGNIHWFTAPSEDDSLDEDTSPSSSYMNEDTLFQEILQELKEGAPGPSEFGNIGHKEQWTSSHFGERRRTDQKRAEFVFQQTGRVVANHQNSFAFHPHPQKDRSALHSYLDKGKRKPPPYRKTDKSSLQTYPMKNKSTLNCYPQKDLASAEQFTDKISWNQDESSHDSKLQNTNTASVQYGIPDPIQSLEQDFLKSVKIHRNTMDHEPMQDNQASGNDSKRIIPPAYHPRQYLESVCSTVHREDWLRNLGSSEGNQWVSNARRLAENKFINTAEGRGSHTEARNIVSSQASLAGGSSVLGSAVSCITKQRPASKEAKTSNDYLGIQEKSVQLLPLNAGQFDIARFLEVLDTEISVNRPKVPDISSCEYSMDIGEEDKSGGKLCRGNMGPLDENSCGSEEQIAKTTEQSKDTRGRKSSFKRRKKQAKSKEETKAKLLKQIEEDGKQRTGSEEEEEEEEKKRPPKENQLALKKVPKLYGFLLKILKSPDKYPCVEWVSESSQMFRIRDSASLAQLWGIRKRKPNMKYENFARTLRGYIARGLLLKPRKKLFYQFAVSSL